MSRTQPKKISGNEKKDLLDELWSMITLLETKKEIENFFCDLLSESESIMIARRIRIARMLLEGKSYDIINNSMNAGYGTIANVHQWLQGKNEGYLLVLPRLKKELLKKMKKREKQMEQKQSFSFEWIKKRYPLHFILYNILDKSDDLTTKRKK